MTEPLVKIRGITKRFGGVTALQSVDLEAFAGEVLAIIGDNGAGKSILIKVLAGVYEATEGELFFDGRPIQFSSHAGAIARVVYHEGLRVLVMEEPTAALGHEETARTPKLITMLKKQGLAVLIFMGTAEPTR